MADDDDDKGSSGFKIGLFLLVVCIASVGARMVLTPAPTAQGQASPPAPSDPGVTSGGSGRTSLVPTGAPDQIVPPIIEPAPAPEEPSALADAMPFVTEASFFAFIGFALGYAARKVLKLAMIFIAILFVVIQGLSYLGILTMDWSKAVDVVNDFVLNLKENETWKDLLYDRIPTVGSFGVGYLMGFRKG